MLMRLSPSSLFHLQRWILLEAEAVSLACTDVDHQRIERRHQLIVGVPGREGRRGHRKPRLRAEGTLLSFEFSSGSALAPLCIHYCA